MLTCMAELSISVTRHVNAPADTVWQVLTDLDNAADTLSGVIRIERLAGEGYAVGTKWRETRKMMGKEATEDMWGHRGRGSHPHRRQSQLPRHELHEWVHPEA